MSIGARKTRPTNIVVFGASGHIGKPLALHARYRAPDVNLRLVSSSQQKRDALAAEFPESECVVADLFDADSLGPALKDAEAIFLVTPSPFDEARAMTNFVDTVKRVARPVHIARIVGYEPESLPRRVPESIRRWGGTAQQHYVAKRILDESDLPVTYLNIGATYLDNFLTMAPIIKQRRLLVYPKRYMAYIDARDIGELGANLLLSSDERQIFQFHTLNNGQDLLTVEQVLEAMSDVLKTKIDWEWSREAFVREYGAALAKRRRRPDAAEQILDFLDYEQGNAAFHHLNDVAERLLGRKPTSVRAWFMEHRRYFAD